MLADISALVATATATTTTEGSLPLFLGGHSMGGARALQWAARAPAMERRRLRGYLAAAPLLRFHANVAPPHFFVWMFNLAARWLPGFRIKFPCPHEPQQPRHTMAQQALEEENARLRHQMMTLSGAVDMFRGGEELASGLCDISVDVHGHDEDEDQDEDEKAQKSNGQRSSRDGGDMLSEKPSVEQPPAAAAADRTRTRTRGKKKSLWMCIGEHDEIVCAAAMRSYFSRSPVADKSMRTYAGVGHDLHQGWGSAATDEYAQDVAAWILARV